MKRVVASATLVLVLLANCIAQQQPEPTATPSNDANAESLVIPKDAKVFVAAMPDNFDEFIRTAINKKNVPVTLVQDRASADFEISGFSESQKAVPQRRSSWAAGTLVSPPVSRLQI